MRTIRVVIGRPWKDAVISVLQPSLLRPWDAPSDVAPGDEIIAVLSTDPVAVFTAIGVVGPDGDIHEAIAGSGQFLLRNLVELSSLNMLTDLSVDLMSRRAYHNVDRPALQHISDIFFPPPVQSLRGHSTLTAARILLQSEGVCTACGRLTDLTGQDAASRVEIHTVAASPGESVSGANDFDDEWMDWPAALCVTCHARMQRQEFGSVIDLKFSFNPQCPQCGQKHSRSALYGLPAGPIEGPWIATMGCVVTEPAARWMCGDCGFQW